MTTVTEYVEKWQPVVVKEVEFIGITRPTPTPITRPAEVKVEPYRLIGNQVPLWLILACLAIAGIAIIGAKK